MSQPANDEFSQHLSDDEESNHEDASDTGAAPKQKQQVIPQTTAISIVNSHSEEEHIEDFKEVMMLKKSVEAHQNRCLVGNVQQRGHMMERRGETHFINTTKLKAREESNELAVTKGMMVMSIGEKHTKNEMTNHALMTISSSSEDHPLKNMVDRGIFDSGCSGHMTGNKDQLEDFEEFNEGSVTFGGSKGYISGKGKIRVGNLDFDSVSFVKELGHFNLFSISQICDKQHKVLFTETECLVILSNFKMPDENQILLKHRRFSWVFFLASKDETSGILQNFIRQIENQLSHRVKIIRLDNDNEFKNRNMLEFCGNKGIKHRISKSKLHNRNGVTERMNMTLIEAARTMPSRLTPPSNQLTFGQEAVSTACYIFNRGTFHKLQVLMAFEEKDEDEYLLESIEKNTSTSTPSVNTCSKSNNTGSFDPDDSPMAELEIFHKSETGIFDEAS
ncbi:putative ribonuclease H-like domain-containing protein [Tanacetum coccineum]